MLFDSFVFLSHFMARKLLPSQKLLGHYFHVVLLILIRVFQKTKIALLLSTSLIEQWLISPGMKSIKIQQQKNLGFLITIKGTNTQCLKTIKSVSFEILIRVYSKKSEFRSFSSQENRRKSAKSKTCFENAI